MSAQVHVLNKFSAGHIFLAETVKSAPPRYSNSAPAAWFRQENWCESLAVFPASSSA